MINILLKLSVAFVKKSLFQKKARFLMNNIKQHIKKIDLSQKKMLHVQNVLVLALSYTFASIIIYPEFLWMTYGKELFSLLCIYSATFLWFAEHAAPARTYNMIVGATALFAPVIFMNNIFSVAIFTITAIVITEYIVYSYCKGCHLFSPLIPVYVICDNADLAKIVKNELFQKFKVLEVFLVDHYDKNDRNDFKMSAIKCRKIEEQLEKINLIPFFPFPRRIMYASTNTAKALNYFPHLHRICVNFSIPLLKISYNGDLKNPKNPKLNISPVTVRDMLDVDCGVYLKHKERGALNFAFKNSRVWIFFDGRSIVVDLIHAISMVSSVDLTILCEPGYLSDRLLEELQYRRLTTNYKIKITDINMLSVQEAKPDIIFYSTPVKSTVQDRYNLKEIFIKNVLDTKTIIEYAQNARVRQVFLMSGADAFNAFNWVGVTQRLSEILVRQAARKHKTLFTKFRAIRVPECVTDTSGMFNKIVYSILTSGNIEFNFSKDKIPEICQTQDIFLSLLRLIFEMLKEENSVFNVYAVSPNAPSALGVDDLTKIAAGMFGLRANDDIRVSYNTNVPVVDIEDCPSIKEDFEDTDIPNVIRMKQPPPKEAEEDINWDMEQIRKMKMRELMSVVFQAISDDTKK